jgi:secondary thiamine-phosphate synthase enzyme
MIQQVEITLQPKSRGFHLVTCEIMRQLPKLPKTGIINIFCKHTSCGLGINENADPDVRVDMETIFNRLVPENRPEYKHTLEGADDMPAHAKSILSGVSLTIPITNGQLYHHTHALFTFKKDGQHGMAGGHLKSTTVLYTAEIELRPTVGGSIGRKFDPETGTGFWNFK